MAACPLRTSWTETSRWSGAGSNSGTRKARKGVDEVFADHFRDSQLEQRLDQPLTLEIFKGSLRALEGAIGRARFEEREMLAEVDRVMVRWTLHARHQGTFWGLPPTGRSFDLDGVNIFRIEGDRIVERLSFVDAPSLLELLAPPAAPAPGGDGG